MTLFMRRTNLDFIFFLSIRAEQDEKVELVKPEWMNKNKEDMSEEEKKLLKEFEKKMAIFKVRFLIYFMRKITRYKRTSFSPTVGRTREIQKGS